MRVACTFAALSLALAAVPAVAQPVVGGMPTATRPITQPTFGEPATAAPRIAAPSTGFLPVGPMIASLPSGSYRFEIDWPANTFTPGSAAILARDVVSLTHTGANLSFYLYLGGGAGMSMTGTSDASGAIALSAPVQGGTMMQLSGTATGSSASGDVLVTGGSHPLQGTFVIVPVGQPETRARSSQLVESINALLHAIGCWAHGGAGC